MSIFKVSVIGGVIVGVTTAPLLGKDATGMAHDLGKYTGLIASATSTSATAGQVHITLLFEAHDGSGKTFEAPVRPIKPVTRYRLP
jgi:hypothetical protein